MLLYDDNQIKCLRSSNSKLLVHISDNEFPFTTDGTKSIKLFTISGVTEP